MIAVPRLLSLGIISRSCCHRWHTYKLVNRSLQISTILSQTKPNQRIEVNQSANHKSAQNQLNNNLNEEISKSKAIDGYDKVFTFPNILCMIRIAFTPVIGYLVIDQHFTTALTLCAIGSVTDLLDGYIARKYDCVTQLGAILDPLADKLLVATLTITLTVVHLIPLWLTLLILTRDSLILMGAMYMMHRRLTPPKTLKRFIGMSTEMSNKQFSPTFISKVNTGFQLSLVAITLSAPVFGFADHWLLTALQLATGATTLTSGLNYLKRLRPSNK